MHFDGLLKWCDPFPSSSWVACDWKWNKSHGVHQDFLHFHCKQSVEEQRFKWGLPAIWQQCNFKCCFQVNRQSAEALERRETSLFALLQGSHQWEEFCRAGVQWRLHCLWWVEQPPWHMLEWLLGAPASLFAKHTSKVPHSCMNLLIRGSVWASILLSPHGEWCKEPDLRSYELGFLSLKMRSLYMMIRVRCHQKLIAGAVAVDSVCL